MKTDPTREELERARAQRLADTCSCCGAHDDDGSVAYECVVCDQFVCGACLQPSKLEVCLDCMNPEDFDD